MPRQCRRAGNPGGAPCSFNGSALREGSNEERGSHEACLAPARSRPSATADSRCRSRSARSGSREVPHHSPCLLGASQNGAGWRLAPVGFCSRRPAAARLIVPPRRQGSSLSPACGRACASRPSRGLSPALRRTPEETWRASRTRRSRPRRERPVPQRGCRGSGSTARAARGAGRCGRGPEPLPCSVSAAAGSCSAVARINSSVTGCGGRATKRSDRGRAARRPSGAETCSRATTERVRTGA